MCNAKSCPMISNFELVFNGMINEDLVSFCCYDYKRKPTLKLSNDIELNEKMICDFHKKSIREIAKGIDSKYEDCIKCEKLENHNQKISNKIEFVNLSLYPSPCQLNCCYCDIRKNPNMMQMNKKIYNNYDTIFKTIDKLKSDKVISDKALWQISCGEITIHPFKDYIFNIVDQENVIFYTNCVKYDDKLSEILKNNSQAYINCSLDCGTKKTWLKVKGMNNYEMVLSNLKKYALNSSPEQILLKYIIIPGINSDLANMKGIINNMTELGISHIILAKDYDDKNYEKFQICLNKFISLLNDYNFTYELAS